MVAVPDAELVPLSAVRVHAPQHEALQACDRTGAPLLRDPLLYPRADATSNCCIQTLLCVHSKFRTTVPVAGTVAPELLCYVWTQGHVSFSVAALTLRTLPWRDCVLNGDGGQNLLHSLGSLEPFGVWLGANRLRGLIPRASKL